MAEVTGFCGDSAILVGVLSISRTPSFCLANKLKALKIDLKKWNEDEFDNVEERYKLWKGLGELDSVEETVPLSDEEKLEKDWLLSDLKSLLF